MAPLAQLPARRRQADHCISDRASLSEVAQTLDEKRVADSDGAGIQPGARYPRRAAAKAHRMSIHNIQCWKNSAVGLAGFATGNQELVREAIDDPDRGFRAQIARGVTDDGLWYEGSLGYHQYTMQAVWPLMEAARHAGIDLYTGRARTLF